MKHGPTNKTQSKWAIISSGYYLTLRGKRKVFITPSMLRFPSGRWFGACCCCEGRRQRTQEGRKGAVLVIYYYPGTEKKIWGIWSKMSITIFKLSSNSQSSEGLWKPAKPITGLVRSPSISVLMSNGLPRRARPFVSAWVTWGGVLAYISSWYQQRWQ